MQRTRIPTYPHPLFPSLLSSYHQTAAPRLKGFMLATVDLLAADFRVVVTSLALWPCPRLLMVVCSGLSCVVLSLFAHLSPEKHCIRERGGCQYTYLEVPSLSVCRLQTSCAALSSCDLLCCTALDVRHGEGGTAGGRGGGKGCALVITLGVANEEWKEESSQIPRQESR